MKNSTVLCIVVLCAYVALNGCDSQKESIVAPPLSDYYPFKVGTSLLYRLDSTVRAPSNIQLIVISYQAKDSIESTFLDNQGRQSYRIFRYIRNLSGTQPWQFASTIYATPTANAVEYVENNLRFIKLVAPLRNGYRFKAHSYIQTSSQFDYLLDWEYQYQNVGEPYKIGNTTFDSTITVLQKDETDPAGPFNPANFQIRNYGIEVYSKGLGLIYKEFLHSNYQASPPPAQYLQATYGIKLTLIK